MRFTQVVMAYFVIGAVMWGGGALAWSEAGVPGKIIENPQTGAPNQDLKDTAERQDGVIDQIATYAAGPINIVWNLVIGLLAFMFWPLTAMAAVHAPPRLTVLIGGSLTLAFYLGLIRVVRTSA